MTFPPTRVQGRILRAFSRWPGPAVTARLAAPVFQWLRDTGAPEPEEVRARLVRTVIDRRAPLVFGAFSIGMMAVMAGLRTGAAWPWLWLVAELALCALRVGILALAHRPEGYARDGTVAWLMGLGVLWSGVFGAGCWACALSGDPVLMVLAGINVAGVAGAISSRNAAMPRYGVLAIVVCCLPYGIGIIHADLSGPELSGLVVVGLMIPVWIGVMSAILFQNFDIALRMIRAELATRRIARTDGLTGLANRLGLEEALAKHCRHGQRGANGRFAMLCIDLDGFKAVNDRHGHVAGDRLLAAVGRRLANAVREGDTVFRHGGDEFVALLPGASAAEAAFVGSRIITALARSFDLGTGEPVSIGASIGAVRAPDDGNSADDLLALADRALYEAKRAGKGIYRAHASRTGGRG